MYPTEFVPDPELTPTKGPALSAAVKDVLSAASDLVAKEVSLAKVELRESIRTVQESILQMAVFGGLILMSTIPFIAFLVVVIGDWLDLRYSLSSLIVSIAMAAIGAVFYLRARHRLSGNPLSFTNKTLHQAARVSREKLDDIKQSTFGGRHGTPHSV